MLEHARPAGRPRHEQGRGRDEGDGDEHTPTLPGPDGARSQYDGGMSWFDRLRRESPEPGDDPGPEPVPDPSDPTVPTALSDERIVAWLEHNGYTWFRDNEGDLGGLWSGRLFYFFRRGPQDEILQVRGHWNRRASVVRVIEILEVCNEWAEERIWPSAYTQVTDDGQVSVVAETAADLEHGATDDQLSDLLECGLGTGMMFFDELDARFPDPLRGSV